ncbi:MAG TPA: hypothetical protein VG474_01000 [Solirubrobacteraceae bacterium]|nr:hypothetical protein [Solirubrobacteraceae bacterium]
MTRPSVAPLACVLLLALAGCGPRAAGPSSQRAEQPTTVSEAEPAVAGVDEGALPAAGRAALRYALAARTWTASSREAQHRRQLALSAGPLRRGLQQAAPTREQLARYRADDAEATATPIAVTSLLESATQARFTVLLDERSSAAEQTAEQRAGYLVELRRHNGRWLVSAFTIQP